MKATAWIYLWWNGYCPRHLCQKKTIILLEDVYSFCEECEQEIKDAQDAKLNAVIASVRMDRWGRELNKS